MIFASPYHKGDEQERRQLLCRSICALPMKNNAGGGGGRVGCLRFELTAACGLMSPSRHVFFCPLGRSTSTHDSVPAQPPWAGRTGGGGGGSEAEGSGRRTGVTGGGSGTTRRRRSRTLSSLLRRPPVHQGPAYWHKRSLLAFNSKKSALLQACTNAALVFLSK